MQKENIKIYGHYGTWHVINEMEIDGEMLYLLEHETYGDEATGLIVNDNLDIVCDDVWNGFDDYYEQLGREREE